MTVAIIIMDYYDDNDKNNHAWLLLSIRDRY